MSQVISYGAKPGAAGTRVTIRTGAPAGPRPRFGFSAWVGAFKWGPVGEAIVHGTSGGFQAWSGPSSFEEDAARAVEAMYAVAAQDRVEPEIACLRVTDGNELTARFPVLNRDANPSQTLRTPPAQDLTRVGYVEGAFPGERGGAQFLVVGRVADVAAAISSATFDTGQSGEWPANRLKDATFGIVGDSKTYRVASSSAAGILTMSEAIVTALTGAQIWYALVPATQNPEIAGFSAPLYVGAFLRQSKASPYGAFAIETVVDGKTTGYSQARCEWTDERNPETLLDDAITARVQGYLAFDNEFALSGLDNLEKNLPANWAGIAAEGGIVAGSESTVTVQWWTWERTSADGKGPFVGDVSGQNGLVPCDIVCTMDGAGGFSVAITDQNGNQLAYDLADGTLGTEYDTGVPYLPTFTLYEGETASIASETVTIHCRPLPFAGAASGGCKLFPFAFVDTGSGSKDSTLSYPVLRGTYRSVTVPKAVDLSALVEVPAVPSVEGSIAPTYNLGTNPTFKWYDGDGTGAPSALRTVTDTTGNATATAAQVVLEFNTRIAAEYGTDPVEVEFYVTDAGKVGVRGLLNVGSDAVLRVSDGTLNAIIGVADDTSHTGTDGSVMRLEFPQACTGGFDGHHGLVAQDIVDAVSPVSSALDVLEQEKGVGLIWVCAPGYADQDVNAAIDAYAKAHGWAAVGEADRTVTDPSAAALWRRNTVGESRTWQAPWVAHYLAAHRPWKPNPTVADSMVGPYIGRKAAAANIVRGYHVVAAGPDRGSLAPAVKRLPFSTAGGYQPDDAILTAAGLVPIWHVGPSVYIYGDEGPDEGGGTYWIHKMETVLDMGRKLKQATDVFVYKEIPKVWPQVEMAIRGVLLPFFRAGAFKAAAFDKAVRITVGQTNNPSAVQNAGQVIADVELLGPDGSDDAIVDTSKNVHIILAGGRVAVTNI